MRPAATGIGRAMRAAAHSVAADRRPVRRPTSSTDGKRDRHDPRAEAREQPRSSRASSRPLARRRLSQARSPRQCRSGARQSSRQAPRDSSAPARSSVVVSLGVMPGNHAQHDGRVGDGAGHRPDMVERIGQRPHAGAAHPSPGRLDRRSGRTRSTAGGSSRPYPSRASHSKGRRPSRRPTPTTIRPVQAPFSPRALTGVFSLRVVARPIAPSVMRQLAEQHRAGALQPVDHRRIGVGHVLALLMNVPALVGAKVVLQRSLTAMRHAMQWPAPHGLPTARPRPVARWQGRARAVTVVKLLSVAVERCRSGRAASCVTSTGLTTPVRISAETAVRLR